MFDSDSDVHYFPHIQPNKDLIRNYMYFRPFVGRNVDLKNVLRVKPSDVPIMAYSQDWFAREFVLGKLGKILATIICEYPEVTFVVGGELIQAIEYFLGLPVTPQILLSSEVYYRTVERLEPYTKLYVLPLHWGDKSLIFSTYSDREDRWLNDLKVNIRPERKKMHAYPFFVPQYTDYVIYGRITDFLTNLSYKARGITDNEKDKRYNVTRLKQRYGGHREAWDYLTYKTNSQGFGFSKKIPLVWKFENIIFIASSLREDSEVF